jgi:hypothetical protein
MSADFDRLATELDTLRARIVVEREQYTGKPTIGGVQELLATGRQFLNRLARLVHVDGLFSGDHKINTWSRLLTAVTLGPTHAVEREQRAGKPTPHGVQEPLATEQRFRARLARLVHVGGHKIKACLSLLRPITAGPTHFPHLGPRLGLASIERRKEAGIITGIVLAALGTLALGAVSLAQFNRIKIEVAGLERDLAATREKLAKLEANVVVAASHAKEMKQDADDRTVASENRTPTTTFILTRDEIQLIRDFIKVPPPLPGAAQKISVGDRLPDIALALLPEPIMDKVPKLRGARFTVDRNSAIVVVAPGSNRADVIINPS